jgi:hypothetical protein
MTTDRARKSAQVRYWQTGDQAMAVDADRGCVMNVVTGEMHASKAHSRLPNTAASIPGSAPVSFVIGVSDGAILKTNFLASPCMAAADAPHQVILMRGGPNVSAKLQRGLKHAENDWVVCMHQDVWLPPGWDIELLQQIHEAERRFGPIGVAGVYGVGDAIAPDGLASPLAAERIGWVVDRGRTLKDGPELPATVATLDELLLVVRRESGLRFDPALGNHFYGADICLQARERGLANVVLGALCYHNSRHVGLGEGFDDSAAVFARKWAHRLPIATPCVVIDREGVVHILGNATPEPRSVAYALPSRRDITAEHGEMRSEESRRNEELIRRPAGNRSVRQSATSPTAVINVSGSANIRPGPCSQSL